MRVYRERLGVPASWWLVISACVLLLGTTVWAGFSGLVALAVYAVLECSCAALFLIWGSATIEVTQSELVATSQRIPLDAIGEVTALDVAQTRALRGPRADPAAFLLVRPYLPLSVYVEIAGRPADRPYWLLASKRPGQLAAAIEQARSTAGHSRPCNDEPVDQGASGSQEAAELAHPGKDSDAW